MQIFENNIYVNSKKMVRHLLRDERINSKLRGQIKIYVKEEPKCEYKKFHTQKSSYHLLLRVNRVGN